MLFYFDPKICTSGTMAHVMLHTEFSDVTVYILAHGIDVSPAQITELLTKYNQGLLMSCSAQCLLRKIPFEFKDPSITVCVTLYVQASPASIPDIIQLLSVEYHVTQVT